MKLLGIGVLLLSYSSIAVGLQLQQRAILDFLFKSAEQTLEEKMHEFMSKKQLNAMKDLLQSGISSDCKSTVEGCISRKGTGNCKSDIEECAKEAVFGQQIHPTYSSFGPDVSLQEIMDEIATEVGLNDGSAVARKLLRSCMAYQRSNLLTSLESLIRKKEEKLKPQTDFLCRALTGKDIGTFKTTLTVPLTCKNFEDIQNVCKGTHGKVSISQLFNTYFPIIVKAEKLSITNPDTIDLRNCWNYQQDRTICINTILLGRMCQPGCPTAECVYNQMRADKECYNDLHPISTSFFSTANRRCADFTRALNIDISDIFECDNIDPEIDQTTEIKPEANKRRKNSGFKICFLTPLYVYIITVFYFWLV